MRTRILSPEGTTDAFAGLSTVDVRVLQPSATSSSASVIASASFSITDPLTIPDSGVDPRKPIAIAVIGKDAAGASIRSGRTRWIDLNAPANSQKTFGLYFSDAGAPSLLPSHPATARSRAAAAVLDDGRIVLAGGVAGASVTGEVEVYDPDAGTWSSLGALATPRSDAGAFALPDGRVVVAGGLDAGGNELDSAEILALPIAGATPAPGPTTATLPATWRAMHVVRLPSGKVLLGGGFSRASSPPGAVTFDPASSSFAPVSGSSYAPGAGVAAIGSRVVIVGGTNGTGSPVSTVELAEESGASVSVLSSTDILAVPRTGASVHAVTLASGSQRVLVAGGSSAPLRTNATAALELLDLSGTAPVASFPGEREHHHRAFRASGVLGDGRVLLAGGISATAVEQPTTEVWDPRTQRIEDIADLPAVLDVEAQGAAELADGTLLLLGQSADTALRAFQPAIDALAETTPRVNATFTLVDGNVASGGVRDGATDLRLRLWDQYSLVDERHSAVGSAAIDWPAFLTNGDDLHVTVEALGAVGAAAWGATSSPFTQADQQAGALTLLLGRTDAWTGSPAHLPSLHGDGVSAQMANGDVVVVGGASGAGATDLYHPADGTSVASGSTIPTSRQEIRAAIQGTTLFVVGALDGAGTATTATSLFDLVAGTWSAGPVIPGGANIRHELVPLPGGRILLHGNEAGGVPLAHSIRGNATNWAGTTGSSPARSRHQATMLGDGTVLITGGITSNGLLAVSKSAEIYNPATQLYAPTGDMNVARRDHVAFAVGAADAVVCGGRVLLGGGAGSTIGSCERFHAGAWTTITPLPDLHDDMSVAKRLDGKIMLVGANGEGGVRSTMVEVFDPADGSLSPGPSLITARSALSPVVLPDGRVIAAGGLDSNGNGLDVVEVYTPPKWTNPFGY